MARIIPDGWRELEVTGGVQREIETLAVLEKGLPDTYRVYHGVHWTNLDSKTGRHVFGEIDFIVLNSAGHALLIEQKSGELEEDVSGLFKVYPEKRLNVKDQLLPNRGLFLNRVRKLPGLHDVRAETLLYCPDYEIRKPATVSLLPARIVDASSRNQLAAVIRRELPDNPKDDEETENDRLNRLDRFLRGWIEAEPDVSALLGRTERAITRISGGLAHWARQLEFEPFRLRVIGTAGSGKTQLALREFEACIDKGLRPLYVCFNRPLADHFARIAPDGGMAVTLHMLCDKYLRDHGIKPDFERDNPFDWMVERAMQLPVPATWMFDCVIVDEGQDFDERWRDLVFRHARSDARILWLEDPMQRLYDRPEVRLPSWVQLRANSNFRSPRQVVRALSNLLPDMKRIEPAGPLSNAHLEILEYSDHAGLVKQVEHAIHKLRRASFTASDIALVTFRGVSTSELFGYTRFASFNLRKFTSRYDLWGHPIFSGGRLLMDSVYRFKGQSAPAIIFAEIDFTELDDKVLRKLFVGMTRARIRLILVASTRAAPILSKALAAT